MSERERTASYWIGRIGDAFAEEDRAAARAAMQRKMLPTTEGPHPEHLGLKSARQIDSGSGQIVDGVIKVVAGGLRLSAGIAGVTAAIGAGLVKDGSQIARNIATRKPLLESIQRKRG